MPDHDRDFDDDTVRMIPAIGAAHQAPGTPMAGPPAMVPVRTVAEHDHIRRLQTLLYANTDSGRYFEQAASSVAEPSLRELFSAIAAERHRHAEELARHIADRAAEPRTGETVGGALHALWLRFKSAIGAEDVATMLRQCAALEEHLERQYADAPTQDLPAGLDATLARHREAIHARHEQIRALSEQLR